MRVVIDTNIMVSAYLGGALKAIIVSWRLGKFTVVVSGDNHLLDLKSFRGIPIITARDFVNRLKSQ